MINAPMVRKFLFCWSSVCLAVVAHASGVMVRNQPQPKLRSGRFSLVLLSKNFILTALTFRELIHFQFIVFMVFLLTLGVYTCWGKTDFVPPGKEPLASVTMSRHLEGRLVAMSCPFSFFTPVFWSTAVRIHTSFGLPWKMPQYMALLFEPQDWTLEGKDVVPSFHWADLGTCLEWSGECCPRPSDRGLTFPSSRHPLAVL